MGLSETKLAVSKRHTLASPLRFAQGKLCAKQRAYPSTGPGQAFRFVQNDVGKLWESPGGWGLCRLAAFQG